MEAKWVCLAVLLLILRQDVQGKTLISKSTEDDPGTDDSTGSTEAAPAWKLEDYFSGVNLLDAKAATSLLSTITSLTRPIDPAAMSLPSASKAKAPIGGSGAWSPPPGGYAAYFARLAPSTTATAKRTVREAETDSFSKANLKKRSPGMLLPYLAMAAATSKPGDPASPAAAMFPGMFPGMMMPPTASAMGPAWPLYMSMFMKGPSLKKMMLMNMMSQMAAAAQPTTSAPAPAPSTAAADTSDSDDSSEVNRRMVSSKTMKTTTKDGTVASPDLWMWDPVLLKQLLGGDSEGTTEASPTTASAPSEPPKYWMVEDMGAIDPSVFVSSKMAYLEKMLEALSLTTTTTTTTAAPTTKSSKKGKEATTVAPPTDAELLQKFLDVLAKSMKASATKAPATKAPPPKKSKPTKVDKKLSKIKATTTTTPAPTPVPTVDPETYLERLVQLLRDSAGSDESSSIETRSAKMMGGPMGGKSKKKGKGKFPPSASASAGLTEEQLLLKQLLDVVGPKGGAGVGAAPTFTDPKEEAKAAKADAKASKKAKKYYAKGALSMEDIFDDDTSYEKRAVVDAKKNATTTVPLNFWVPPPLLMDPAYYLNKKMDFLSNLLEVLANATNATSDVAPRMVKPPKKAKADATTPASIKINSAIMMDPTFLLDKSKDTFLDKFFQDLLAAEMNDTEAPAVSRASRAVMGGPGGKPMKPGKASKKSKVPPSPAAAPAGGAVPPGFFMSKKMAFLSKLLAAKANATTTTTPAPTTEAATPLSPAQTFGLMLQTNLDMMSDMFNKVMTYKNSLVGTLADSPITPPTSTDSDESSSAESISTRKIKDPMAPAPDPLANFDVLEALLDKMTEFKKKLAALSTPPEPPTTTTEAPDMTGRATLSPGLQAMMDAMAAYRTKLSTVVDDGSTYEKRSPVPDPGVSPSPLDSKSVLMELETMGKVLERLSSFQKKLAKMNATAVDGDMAKREATTAASDAAGLFGSSVTPDAVVQQMDAMDKILARLASFKKSLATFALSRRAAVSDPDASDAAPDDTTFNPLVAAQEMAVYAKFMKSYADFQKKMAVITNPTTPSPFTLAKKAFFANLFTPPALAPPASTAARSVRSLPEEQH